MNKFHNVDFKKNLYWCPNCNVPLLSRQCNICSSNGFSVDITPPGEFRPANIQFKKDFSAWFKNYFGAVLDTEHNGIILNKVGGEDRTDEVVWNGYNIGTYEYSIKKEAFDFHPNINAALLFSDRANKHVLEFGIPKNRHLKNNWLEANYLKGNTSGLVEGDYIFLSNSKYVAVGVWYNGKIRIKDVSKRFDLTTKKEFSLDKMVRANNSYMKKIIANAKNELVEVTNEYKIPYTVSLSGGKDSLVAFHLLYSIKKDFDIIYIDTGIEFKENLEFVKKISNKFSIPYYVARAGNAFEDNFHTFGPPGKDFRWCCKVAKLGPVTKLIKERYPHGSVSIEGTRWLESFDRSKIGLKEKNPFVPGQVQINPIRSWNAMEVWLYIYMMKLPYNELYDLDFERLGCYMCPSGNESEFSHVKRFFPDLAKQWEIKLEGWRKSKGYGKEYISKGLWRWKKAPPKMRPYYKAMVFNSTEDVKENDLKLEYTNPSPTCSTNGQWAQEGILKIPNNFGFERTSNGLAILGEVKYSSEFNVATIKGKKGESAIIFANGDISVSSDSENKTKEFFERIVKQVVRVQLCTKCNICVKRCPKNAITIDDTIKVNTLLCTKCGACEEGCVLSLYYDRLFM